MAKKFTMETIKLTEANREINQTHVEKLVAVIGKEGYINALPIVVDPDGFIIDGQHRYLACKQLGIDAPIVVEKNFDIVATLNSTQLNWSLKDYIKFYAEKGYEHYIILRALCKAKNITYNSAIAIISGVLPGGDRAVVKQGGFKIPDISEKALKKLDRKVDAILKLCAELGMPPRDRLVITIARLMRDPNFAFATMSSKIAYQKAKIHRCTTIQEYTSMLMEIYNYKNTKKISA